MDQDFPGKETHCWHVCFVFFSLSRSLSGALRRTTQWWTKLPKAKKKPAATIKKKNAKCAVEQDYESTYSFQNCDSRQLFSIQMFLYQGWYLHKERESSFLTLCMVNFGLTATSLFEIWTPAWSSANTSHFHRGSFFFSWQISTLSFFFPFFFSPTTFFRFWFFHEQRFSWNKKLSRANSVKCAM